MVDKRPPFILNTVEHLPSKKMKRSSKVNQVLRQIYDAVSPSEIVEFDPKMAGVNAMSLRSQLRSNVKRGLFSPGTTIQSRNKQWFFRRGEEPGNNQ